MNRHGILYLSIFFGLFVFIQTVSASEPPPIPLSHPDGEIDELSYDSAGTGYFIIKENQGLKQAEVSGRQWRFRLSWQNLEEGKDITTAWFDSQGITLTADKDYSLYGFKPLEGNTALFIRMDGEYDSGRFEIVEQQILSYDAPIKLSVFPDHPTRIFYTTHDGTTMDRLDIDGTAFAPEDENTHLELDIAADLKITQGKLKRSINFSASRETREETYWEIADMPQFPGTYKWTFSLRAGDNAPPFTMMLKKGRPIPGLKPGDTLGGLLVKNVPYGAATAVPEYEGYDEFPGFTENNRVGDVTPTGEALFWLPPGMWAIHVDPVDDDSGTALLKSHFIPVQPGKLTQVEWPKSLNDVFAGGEKGRMKILAATADTQKAIVDIALLGVDRASVVPAEQTLEVAESGQKGQILSVDRIENPADIVLLLDSSGSMRSQMAAALNATKKFIKGIPDNSTIRVVDFDTQPKLLKGNTPDEVLTALKGVKANGATALYDSILEGLDMLNKSDRPSLVVFTDGVDANHDDTGPGSQATKEEVLKAVSESGIPIFTIGFGAKSDVNTLSRIAQISGGEYYVALDEERLNTVFTQINSNLGSQYRVTYERPKASGFSNRPVMSIMVDNSGSMDSWPDECSGCDKRMEKTRQLLRKFIATLPDDFLIQVASFSGDIIVEQVLTDNKPAVLRGIAQMQGRTTTDILGSMHMSLETLQAVPSTRRYLVYLADAALDVDDEEKETFDAILGKIKDAGISALFIGVVDEEDAQPFARAAEKTGGRYVVSKDFKALSQTFARLSEEILGAPKDSDISLLRVNMTHRAQDGENKIFSAAKQVRFPPKGISDTIAQPEAVVYKEGERLLPYDDALSGMISGRDVMMKDVRVIKRLPLNLTARNKAAKIQLKEALSLSRFRGIDAPDHLRYFAVTLEFENILPPQKVAVYPDGANHPAAWVGGNDEPLRYEQRVPTYLIPDIRKHMFLRWNNERSYPVHEVTWLCETPLSLPGDEAIAIEPAGKVKGTLMFMVPSSHMKQSSLHLYDTNYGHIDIPISGILKTTKSDIEPLPKKEPSALSDAFAFSVTGIEKRERIGQTETNPDTTFVIVEGRFSSKVQAHLDLDPKERFSLKVPTGKGALFLPVHPATTLIPLGFFHPAFVTPGAKNPVRMVFNVPQGLLDNLENASVHIDIFGGAVEVPLHGTASASHVLNQADASGQGMVVNIIRSGPLSTDTDLRLGSRLVAVETAIQDTGDNQHTQVGELIVLKNKHFDPQKAAETEKELERLRREAAVLPSRGLANFGQSTLKVVPGMLAAIPSEYYIIGGLDEESVVPDGETRHGVFIFDIPEDTQVTDWEISSLAIPGLSVPFGSDPYSNEDLLAKKRDIENEITSSFQEEIETRLEHIFLERQAAGFIKPGHITAGSSAPGKAEDAGQAVPAPALTLPGKTDLATVDSLDALKKRLTNLKFLPSGAYTSWIHQYAPEAVLSQGWGSENDFAVMLENAVSRMGYSAVRTDVTVTDAGQKKLAALAGLDHCVLEVLPAVRFMDHDGRQHLIVSPFMEEANDLSGLVIEKPPFVVEESNLPKVGLSITLLMKSTGKSAQSKMADIVDILGGGDQGDLYSMTVFSDGFVLPQLSKDAIDIGYTKVPVDGALAIGAVIDTPSGRFRSDSEYCVSTTDFKVVGEIIEIQTPEKTYRRKRMLGDNEKITGVFHTLGINLPDIDAGSVRHLSETAQQMQKAATGKPDAQSALKWHTRSILSRFIAAQTAYENRLAKQLDLTVGRTKKSRVIMVNVIKAEDDTPLSVHMDLLEPHNSIHQPPDEMASRAFNIMAGMAAARFEAQALGDHGIGLFKIWQRMPEDTFLIGVDEDSRSDFVEKLEEKEYPPSMIEYFSSLAYNKIVLFPSAPALVHGKSRWAWLEFNRDTYEVVSVLDTGENGSMVEKAIGNPAEQAGQYMVGVLMGIDVSLWAVAAFSLEMDDYNKILKAAEKFAKNMANNFGVGVKIGDLTIGTDIGGSPAVSYGRGPKAEFVPGDSKVTNNILGFGNGYNDGVAYYFSRAK